MDTAYFRWMIVPDILDHHHAHVDGKSYWENTSHAPLPRREYTKRDDDIISEPTQLQMVNP